MLPNSMVPVAGSVLRKSGPISTSLVSLFAVKRLLRKLNQFLRS